MVELQYLMSVFHTRVFKWNRLAICPHSDQESPIKTLAKCNADVEYHSITFSSGAGVSKEVISTPRQIPLSVLPLS